MKEFSVIVSEKKSHGRYGKRQLIGYYIPAEKAEEAKEACKDVIANSTWNEALQFSQLTEREAAELIGCSLSDLENWMHMYIGQVYAERKFSYKVIIGHVEG